MEEHLRELLMRADFDMHAHQRQVTGFRALAQLLAGVIDDAGMANQIRDCLHGIADSQQVLLVNAEWRREQLAKIEKGDEK